MPGFSFRAMRGLVLVLALLLLAVPVHSKQDDRLDPRAVVFHGDPSLLGNLVASCPGTSPMVNLCQASIRSDACDLGCGPDVAAGLAFTGTVTSLVWGKGREGEPRYLAWSCSFVGGSHTNVLNLVNTGTCWRGGNAEAFPCPDGRPGCYVMWAPFYLEGRAGSHQGLGPTGSWTAKVQSG